MMTQREIDKLVEGYIGSNGGYLNYFSYNIHESFYYKYCDLEVDVPSYRARGLTTRRAFIQILRDAKPRDQAKIIRGVFEMIPLPAGAREDATLQKKLAIHGELLEVAARLEADGQIETPQIALTSQAVLEALKDAEVLLSARGPTSAVDRAHTALHGYLKKVCSERGLAMPTDPSLTVLFKIIREQFNEFSATVPHDAEARKVFGSVASALDSLNTIRNRGTLAHPNELLLDAPEAMLYINLSRAVLAYIETKIRK
ncbi:MAG TPA: abortive infection family protein [Candidatus Acidoferrales bacterium]|nr:abortive infection family protein [Candidatus Acidoferrales bacterium]